MKIHLASMLDWNKHYREKLSRGGVQEASLGRFCNLSGKVLQAGRQLSKNVKPCGNRASRELEEENTAQGGQQAMTQMLMPEAQDGKERGSSNHLLALNQSLSKAPVSARTEYLLDSALFAFVVVTNYYKLRQQKQYS